MRQRSERSERSAGLSTLWRAAVFLCVVSLLPTQSGCGDDESEPVQYVAQVINFAGPMANDVSIGFNLDGIVSDGADRDSCNQVDWTSPNGAPGVDNAFAILWDALLDVAGDAVVGLIAGAIADGTLLMMFELDGVTDPADSECVGGRIFIAAGAPDIGTNGLITSGQTFDRSAGSAVTEIPCGPMKDGVAVMGPFAGVLPIKVLDVRFDLPVHDALMQVRLREDGTMEAIIGAAIANETLKEVALQADNAEIEGLLTVLIDRVADLDPDESGICRSTSATMMVEAVPAFIYADTEL